MFWADCCRGCDFTSWDGDCGTCAQFYCHVCSDHVYVPSHAPSPFYRYRDLILGQWVRFSLHFSPPSFSTPSYAFPPCAVPSTLPQGGACPVSYLMMKAQPWHQGHPLPYGAVIPSSRTELASHHCFFLSSCFFYNLYHIIKHIIMKCFNWFSLICACWSDLPKFKLKVVSHGSCLLLGFTIAWNAGSDYTVNVLWRALNSFWTQCYIRGMI